MYTALSRVRKLENLFIVDEFLSRKISVHPEVSSIVVDPASVFELLYSQLLLSLSCLVILNPLAQYTLFSLQVTLEMDRLRQEAVFPTLQSLSKCCKIRLLFQNVQSLRKNFCIATKQPFFDIATFNIFCETWLMSSDTLPSTFNDMFITRLDFPTCNSNQRHRGGFVIFSKVRLDITSEVTNNVQIACFEFMNLLFIFVHRRPSETPISLFKECLSQKFRQQKKPTIVMGDFNVNLKCDNSSFLRFMGSEGFHCLIDDTTTKEHTLLDHVYCNESNLLHKLNCFVAYNVYSFHEPIVLEVCD